MDALFMVGSFCFALGSVPGFAGLVAPNTVVLVFFVGSLFFTSAAFLQYLQTTEGKVWSWQPTDLAWADAPHYDFNVKPDYPVDEAAWKKAHPN